MRKNTGYRFPATKLLELFDEKTWASSIGEILGVGRSAIQTWRQGKTYFDQWSADRYAIRLGMHPAQIWPEWFEEDVA